jgi:hypothetical protein
MRAIFPATVIARVLLLLTTAFTLTTIALQTPPHPFATLAKRTTQKRYAFDAAPWVTELPTAPILPIAQNAPSSSSGVTAVSFPSLEKRFVCGTTSAVSVRTPNQLALHEAGITHLFPNLVHDLTYGSPIGSPPPLTYSFIPDNLASANLNPKYITNDLASEVASGRMGGPFTVEEAHRLFEGHFRTSPLGLVPKPGKCSDDLRLIRHLSKKDHLGFSTNDWLNSDDFPTKWFSAAHCADFVSKP